MKAIFAFIGNSGKYIKYAGVIVSGFHSILQELAGHGLQVPGIIGKVLGTADTITTEVTKVTEAL